MSLFSSMWLIAAGVSIAGNAPVFAGFFLAAAGGSEISEWWARKRRALSEHEGK